MNFTVEKKELLKALNIVSRAVPLKSSYPIMEGILIEALDNKINLFATDTHLKINTHIEAKISRKGTILVPSKIFNEIIRNLADDEINIDVDENNNISINCLNSHFSISGMDYHQFPQREVYNILEFLKIENETLKKMIRETIFSCATLDSSSQILTGILIECLHNNIKFVAIDGYRMAIREEELGEEFDENIKCVVPNKTMQEVYKIISSYDEDVYIHLTDKKFILNIGKTQLVSDLMQGKFISYNDIIPKESKTIVKIYRDELLSACERASIITDEGKNNLIKMNFTSSILKMSSKSNFGKVDEEVKINKSGEDLEIAFNSKYFIDVLKNIDEEKVILELNNKNTPCLIKSVNSNNYLYLIMPVRVVD